MALGRLGAGPFMVVEVMEPDYTSYGGYTLPEPAVVAGANPDEVWGRCACCGARISWRAVIEGAGGVCYVVGLTCASAAASGIDTRKMATLRARATRRERERKLETDGFREWARAQPHPKGWRGKTLLDDLLYQTSGNNPRMGELRKAYRTFLAGGVADSTLELEAADQEARDRLVTWLSENGAYAAGQPHPFADSVLRTRLRRLRGAKQREAARAEVEALTLADYLRWVLDNRSDRDSYLRALGEAERPLKQAAEDAARAEETARVADVKRRWLRQRIAIGTLASWIERAFEEYADKGDEATLQALWDSELCAEARARLAAQSEPGAAC